MSSTNIVVRCHAGDGLATSLLYCAQGFAGQPATRFMSVCTNHSYGARPLGTLHQVGDFEKTDPLVLSGLSIPCLFGCTRSDGPVPAVGIFYMANGCVCYSEPFQALCSQHFANAEPINCPMEIVADLIGGSLLVN